MREFEPFPRRWQLASPAEYSFTETALTTRASWVRLEIFRPSILRPTAAQGPHQMQYTFTPPDDDTASKGLFYNSDSGVCYLLTEGSWWVRCPGTSGAQVKFVLLDAMSSVALGDLAEAADIQRMDLQRIGGSSQTGFSLEAYLRGLTSRGAWDHKRVIVNTTPAVQVSSLAASPGKAIVFKANPGNSGVIYLGKDSTVTTATGFPLAAGDVLTLDVDNANRVWAIASDAGQDLAVAVEQ